MNIETKRLFIEPLSENDSNFIFELLNTEGWLKFIGNRNIRTNDDAIYYVNKINNNPNTKYWTVKLNIDNTPIGLVTLIKREYLDHNDIGFAFLPQFTKKGFAFEATKAVLDSMISQNDITHIFAVTLPDNMSSIILIEKLGLQFERTLKIENETLSIYKRSYVDTTIIS